MTKEDAPQDQDGSRDASSAEQMLGRRVPPADAETTPGDSATPRPDLHHRNPGRDNKGFIDRAAGGAR